MPIAVLKDTIQPFPTFSEVYVLAMQELTANADGYFSSRSSETELMQKR